MLGIVDEKYSLLQGNYLPCSPHSLSFKTSLKPGREENHLLLTNNAMLTNMKSDMRTVASKK